MSFYDISKNPQDFNVANPANVIKGQINLLNNQFHLSPVTPVVAATGHAYSAYELLNGGFIRRSGAVAGDCIDTFPSAASIVAAAQNRITALAGLAGGLSDVDGNLDNFTVTAEGFSADLVISNQSAGLIETVASDASVSVVSQYGQLSVGDAKMMRIIVTNATSGSEAVVIDMLA
jgi:hypothetical protein